MSCIVTERHVVAEAADPTVRQRSAGAAVANAVIRSSWPVRHNDATHADGPTPVSAVTVFIGKVNQTLPRKSGRSFSVNMGFGGKNCEEY